SESGPESGLEAGLGPSGEGEQRGRAVEEGVRVVGRMSSRLRVVAHPERVVESGPDAGLVQAASVPAPAEAVAARSERVVAALEERPRWMPQRIAVQVVRMPAREFFESLVSHDPDFNMVVHPEVTELISVDLKNVTIDEVVALVCEMHQLDCQPFATGGRERGRGYKIYPWQLSTRTYAVDFLSVVRDGHSQTTVATGNKQDLTATRTSMRDQTRTTMVVPSTPGSSMRTEYKSDFWSDLENSIIAILQLGLVVSQVTEETDENGKTNKKVIRERKGLAKQYKRETAITVKPKKILIEESKNSIAASKKAADEAASAESEHEAELLPSEKGVVVNRQAGLITVRAYPREHREINHFLQQLRQRSHRQVILEAKILEVTLNDGAQFGIDWLAVNRGLGGRTSFNYSGATVGGITSSSGDPGPLANLGMMLTHPAGVDQPINLALKAHDFVGLVHLLQQQGKVQVLSSPRVATVNNQKAVIKVGSDEYFITGMQPGGVYYNTTNSEKNYVSPPILSMESMFTGISLDVTPQVSDTDVITLHIHPLVTEVQDKTKSFLLDDKPQSLPMAYMQTREADSIIRVRNGELAVIGGLMKNRTMQREERLPVLGQLPVVGRLFGRDETWQEKSELVILLRPVVVEEGRDWQEQVERNMERLSMRWQGQM
ncbi:MAG: pilus (MSHA type) biogenesis protein MshL, partial [Magnetococcales bacterium]|nr:pilus (MSHA type) biogenesis protein MshL [Magnetococcales bacterium]